MVDFSRYPVGTPVTSPQTGDSVINRIDVVNKCIWVYQTGTTSDYAFCVDGRYYPMDYAPSLKLLVLEMTEEDFERYERFKKFQGKKVAISDGAWYIFTEWVCKDDIWCAKGKDYSGNIIYMNFDNDRWHLCEEESEVMQRLRSDKGYAKRIKGCLREWLSYDPLDKKNKCTLGVCTESAICSEIMQVKCYVINKYSYKSHCPCAQFPQETVIEKATAFLKKLEELHPEPKYRPFTDEEMLGLWGKEIMKDGVIAKINNVERYSSGVTYIWTLGNTIGCRLYARKLFDYCTFLDGSPCGVKL